MLFTALISAVALIVAVFIAIPLTVTRRNAKNQVEPDTTQGSSKFFYVNILYSSIYKLDLSHPSYAYRTELDCLEENCTKQYVRISSLSSFDIDQTCFMSTKNFINLEKNPVLTILLLSFSYLFTL